MVYLDFNIYTYLSDYSHSQDKASHDRGQHLRNPVEESCWDTNVSSNRHSECDSRIHVSAGDIGGDKHGGGQ